MKVATLHSGCTVCTLAPDARTAVNEAIWPNGTDRARNYRADGLALLEPMLGRRPDPKMVTRHADHVEKEWRVMNGRARPAADVQPVFATDFATVVDRAASLGMRAMDELERDLDGGFVEPKDKVSIAKMGVTAVGQREASRLKGREQNIASLALFGVVSGFIEEPENEVRNVTPLDDLLGPILEERRLLRAAAGHE